MKLVKSLLLGSAAGLATVAAAQAADLPTRKAAPVEYVRICDAYGAGFFYIPGTDTCLRVGGLVLAQIGIQPSTQLYSVTLGPGAAVGNLGGAVGNPGVAGFLPGAGQYASVNQREIFGYTVTGRLELDARTQSPFGTVRSFVRMAMNYGAGANYQTGNNSTGLNGVAFNRTAGPTIQREGVFLDKGFIQFAGITAGRAQSFFDFYADAINYAGLYGSNSSPWLAAYTFTAGGGFSVTGAIEDPYTHRGNVGNVINVANVGSLTPAGANAGGGVAAATGAARMPDLVGNVRYDQPWGAVQLSAALHQIRGNLFSANATSGFLNSGLLATGSYANPVNSYSGFGFAVQGGVQFNLDMLAPGDKLWLQATYARGAIGYVQGNSLAFTSGINDSASYGTGLQRSSNGVGWTGFADVDCAFTYTGGCDKSSGFAAIVALKHYWTPTISSGFFGNYYQVKYSQSLQTPINPFNNVFGTGAAGAGALFTQGFTNFRQTRLGTNLVWTPVKNFDIGAEITWARYNTARPFGLAPDVVLQSFGLPKFTSTTDQFLGAVRMIRAF